MIYHINFNSVMLYLEPMMSMKATKNSLKKTKPSMCSEQTAGTDVTVRSQCPIKLSSRLHRVPPLLLLRLTPVLAAAPATNNIDEKIPET